MTREALSPHGTWFCRRRNELTGRWEVSRPFKSQAAAEREFAKRIYATNHGILIFDPSPVENTTEPVDLQTEPRLSPTEALQLIREELTTHDDALTWHTVKTLVGRVTEDLS